MPRETLDRETHHLLDEVLILGSMVEQATLDAVDALTDRDRPAAKRIYFNDRQINEKRFAIENATLVLLATQQPMAHDLRVMAAILEIITELERIGDYAKGIALVCVRLGDNPVNLPARDFTRMSELAVDMLHRSLDAFVREDAVLARAIPKDDDTVDNLYNKVYRNLVTSMIADPETIDEANLLMWVAHNLERTADRVTNVCERTIFVASGELMELESSNDEDKLDF